ncbi:MAG: antitoxin MazE5 [Acidimicrobiales bacterium]
MPRTRISTTVDQELLQHARETGAGSNDAELIDAALAALLSHYRRVDTDERYTAAYRAHPPEEPDEWGDLSTFRDAASAT